MGLIPSRPYHEMQMENKKTNPHSQQKNGEQKRLSVEEAGLQTPTG